MIAGLRLVTFKSWIMIDPREIQLSKSTDTLRSKVSSLSRPLRLHTTLSLLVLAVNLIT